MLFDIKKKETFASELSKKTTNGNTNADQKICVLAKCFFSKKKKKYVTISSFSFALFKTQK